MRVDITSSRTYQIRQARSYYGEHIRFHGSYRIEFVVNPQAVRPPAATSRSVAPKTRTVAPPVAPSTARATRSAAPTAPRATTAATVTPPASAPARKPLLATPAAPPARPGTSRKDAAAMFAATARRTSSPATHSLLAGPAAATATPPTSPAGIKRYETPLFSPPPPRGSAQDSPISRSACPSRQGSDMSAYSEDSDAMVEDVSVDTPPRPGVEYQAPVRGDLRAQRRPRSSDDDAATEEAKRYCLDSPAEAVRAPPPNPAAQQHAAPPADVAPGRSPPATPHW
ncbi:hypothetical protein PYW08_006163 [Mythimna loreyi]|uniref:Uncharacterized protein n=1 Tax=Mythimna loreyi TaxID=667449 RepID=A0ACC2QME4_9NEOP|nr:hypothetical protein PYW08_006163 [Mythimna loreyi]